LTKKTQDLSGLRGIFLLFNCQTPGERLPGDCQRAKTPGQIHRQCFTAHPCQSPSRCVRKRKWNKL